MWPAGGISELPVSASQQPLICATRLYLIINHHTCRARGRTDWSCVSEGENKPQICSEISNMRLKKETRVGQSASSQQGARAVKQKGGRSSWYGLHPKSKKRKEKKKERNPDIWRNICLKWADIRVRVRWAWCRTRMQHVTPLDHNWPLSCLISPNTPLCSPSHTVSSPWLGPAHTLLFLLLIFLLRVQRSLSLHCVFWLFTKHVISNSDANPGLGMKSDWKWSAAFGIKRRKKSNTRSGF